MLKEVEDVIESDERQWQRCAPTKEVARLVSACLEVRLAHDVLVAETVDRSEDGERARRLAADFDDYLRAQRDVGAAYRDSQRWSRSALLNTAGVGFFSSDRTIRSYDREIWKSTPSLHD